MKHLLVCIPPVPQPRMVQFLNDLADHAQSHDWQVWFLGQMADENGNTILYSNNLLRRQIEPLGAKALRDTDRNGLREHIKAYSRNLQATGASVDLVFCPYANFLMIDDWTLTTPLVAYIEDFSFFGLPADDWFRLFYWETTWRIRERAVLTIFHDDFVEAYARREFNFEKTVVIPQPDSAAYFAAFEGALSK